MLGRFHNCLFLWQSPSVDEASLEFIAVLLHPPEMKGSQYKPSIPSASRLIFILGLACLSLYKIIFDVTVEFGECM